MGQFNNFVNKVTKVQVGGQELRRDGTNPYMNEQWYAANQENKPKLRQTTKAVQRRRNKIFTILSTQPTTSRDLEHKLGYSLGGVAPTLRKMARDGQIERRGYYWITSNAKIKPAVKSTPSASPKPVKRPYRHNQGEIQSPARYKIMAALGLNSPLRSRDLLQASGLKQPGLYSAFHHLRGHGWITRDDQGNYSITDKGRKEVLATEVVQTTPKPVRAVKTPVNKPQRVYQGAGGSKAAFVEQLAKDYIWNGGENDLRKFIAWLKTS